MIAVPPAPPAIEQPAPYEVSFGTVSGRAAPGVRRVLVRAGGRLLADLPLRGTRFHLRVALPVGETTVRVVTVDASGRRSRAEVDHLFGAPQDAFPRPRRARLDGLLAVQLRRVVSTFGPTSAIYVEDMTSGSGAAWNVRAAFPGASTLKLAVAVTALARAGPTPERGSTLDVLLRRMLVVSDNASANAVERWLGGSTSAGSALVNSLMRTLHLVDSDMYGGYELEASALAAPRSVAAVIPLRVDSQPEWGRGKRTSARDLASLLKAVWLASAGRGPLPRAQPGFSARDARYLLYVLGHVGDTGKLGRSLDGVAGARLLHKAGWISTARHDAGIVVWTGGAFVVSVMTYRPGGAGIASDVLAGRVARLALDRFRG